MSASLWLLHLGEWLLPALAMGAAMALLEAVKQPESRRLRPALTAWGLYAGVGLGVLALGLALTGRDGKVLTHVALVVGLGGLASWRWR